MIRCLKTHSSLFVLLFFFQISFAQFSDNTMNLADYLSAENITANSLDQGLYYSIDQPGHGAFPQTGDYLMVHYTGKLLDGTVFDASVKSEPFVFQLGYRQVIVGWELGLTKFQVGTKGKLFIPPGLAYGKRGVGKVIPSNAPLIFEIEVLDIMDFEAYDRYMIALEEKERKAFEVHQREQFATDKKLIQQYSLDHKVKTKRTSSGLSYVLTKKGKGDTAQPGDRLRVHYEGRLLDDTIFDSSFDGAPFNFQLGAGKVIPGWEEGLQFFKKGSEGWLMIPSRLAYGPLAIDEDDIHIPANSVLVFKIKVLAIDEATAQKK